MKTLFAVVTAAALLTSLTGCYKSDWENEQKKSAALQGELDKAKADLAKVNLINYDFAAFGEASMRRRILERWDREIGSLPR